MVDLGALIPALALALLWGCGPDADALRESGGDTSTSYVPATRPGEGGLEYVPGADDAETAWAYDPTVVHEFAITLPQSSIDDLSAAPKEYVPATLYHEGVTYPGVGLRLKGNSSYRWLTEKPALKIKLSETYPDQRLGGLERLTLNNNVNDPSMMAEALAYRLYREAGAPSPRTGYARVTLNGVYLGLYTLVESMDDGFVDHNFPGSGGTLYEPERWCDIDNDWSCYEIDQAGHDHAPDELQIIRDAALDPDFDAFWSHVDDERVLAYLAVERYTNHSDSYSFNGNNHHVFFEPQGARVSLTPWGADSTWMYRYPIDDSPSCEPTLGSALSHSPSGLIAARCEAVPGCADALHAALLDVADLAEALDVPAWIDELHATIAADAASETRVTWTPSQFEQRVACHREWAAARPEVVRAWLGD